MIVPPDLPMIVPPDLAAGDDVYRRPFARPDLPDGARWGRQPRHHNGGYVYPGRAVLVLAGHQWPHQPETCPVSDLALGEWHLDGQVLTCTGCGLDCT
jgi:hypothetical protein